jgi:predicted RNase H-like HicB family nuclease
MVIKVDAFWDSEAGVWVATSEDLPGLVTEASTDHELVEKLRIMIPELIELNLKKSFVSSTDIDLDLMNCGTVP